MGVSFEYVLQVHSGRECVVSRERALSEREVIESPLGSLVVEESRSAIRQTRSLVARSVGPLPRFTPRNELAGR